MNECGITPGPWAIHTGRPIYGFWNIRQDPKNWKGGGYQHICDVPAGQKGAYYGDMFAADARAIVEVPNMIEALENASNLFDAMGYLNHRDEIDAILNRIKGAK